MRLIALSVSLTLNAVLIFALVAALDANRKLRTQLDDILRARTR